MIIGNADMSSEAIATLEVPFHDIDILGIAWHGHYYKYFELARTQLYRQCDFDIMKMKAMGYIFPVIESHCKYVKPLTYGQKAHVSARFSATSNYIQISYCIRDSKTTERYAYGHTKQAVCDANGALLLAVPTEVLEVIKHA